MRNEFEVAVTVTMTVAAEDACEAGARVLAVFADMDPAITVKSVAYEARKDVTVQNHDSPHFGHSGVCLCTCPACGDFFCYCTFGCKGTSPNHHHEAG